MTDSPSGLGVDLDSGASVPAEELEHLYREMCRIRRFEEEISRMYESGELPGSTHLYDGQEAVSVGVIAATEPRDSVSATYRGHGALLARGLDATSLFAELLARATGVCGGRAGSMNVIDLEHGTIGCFGIVGGSIGSATGAGLASQLHRDGSVAIAFFGDGASNQAYFHECLNWASVRKLPVVYVCENNLYGEYTAMHRVTGGASIAARAAGYGIVGAEVDGNDVLQVRAAARDAVARARAGEGPTLLECKTYRHKGHARNEPGVYRPKEEVAEWLERDPLPFLARSLDPDAVERIEAEVREEIATAADAARNAPVPDPDLPQTATKEVSA